MDTTVVVRYGTERDSVIYWEDCLGSSGTTRFFAHSLVSIQGLHDFPGFADRDILVVTFKPPSLFTSKARVLCGH